MSARATVVLSSANMGDVTEDDFDAWAAFVAARIDERTGLDVEVVEQAPFGEAGEDVVCVLGRVSSEEHERAVETIREALRDLWDEFCATPSAWVRTREQWIERAGGRDEAMAYEESYLGVGRSLLPECAVAVLDGAEPDVDYWSWLSASVDKAEAE